MHYLPSAFGCEAVHARRRPTRIRAGNLTDAEMALSDAPGRGITVTEIAAMDQPVDLTPETTAAFVGRTLRGPLNIPVRVENFGDFRRRFGGIWSESDLGPAVRDFFDHGGSRLYVVRVANNARGALICLPASGGALVLRAVEPGSAETLRAAVDYDNVPGPDDFNLTLQRIDRETGHVLDQEYFGRVSHRRDSDRFVLDVLLGSEMARVEQPLPTQRPESTVGIEHGIGVEYVKVTEPGADGQALTDYDLVGSRAKGTGIFALDNLNRFDILYLPPASPASDTGPAAMLAAEIYCRQRGAILVCDPRSDWHDPQSAVLGLRQLGYASPNMFCYFPRVVDARGRGGRPRVVGGAIAGLLSRLDAIHGPWHSLDQRSLALKRDYSPWVRVDERDASLLERSGLNSLLADATNRLRVVGDRTLARGSGPYRRQTSLRVQRLSLALMHAIDRATRWAVFESPSEKLAASVRAQVAAGLLALHAAGALADETFDVQCNLARGTSGGGHAVEILISFTPTGSHVPIACTLHQSVTGFRVTSTAFAPAGRAPGNSMPELYSP